MVLDCTQGVTLHEHQYRVSHRMSLILNGTNTIANTLAFVVPLVHNRCQGKGSGTPHASLHRDTIAIFHSGNQPPPAKGFGHGHDQLVLAWLEIQVERVIVYGHDPEVPL